MKTKITLLSSIAISTALILSALVQTPIFASPTPAVETPSAPSAGQAASSQVGAANATNPNDWGWYTGPGSTGEGGWNYSPQTQINASSVGRLAVSYVYPIPSVWNSPVPLATREPGVTYSTSLEGTQASVLSQGGVGFVVANSLSVYAFSLADGHQIFEADPSFAYSSWLKEPWAAGGQPSHLHPVNLVDGIVWDPGLGCGILGFDAVTAKVRVNITGECSDIPGDKHPLSGYGQYFNSGDSAIQVDVAHNAIIYYEAGASEGADGGRTFIYACSLSAALAGQNCVANGGACTTIAGGACSAGSTLLWRAFLMPDIGGSQHDFSTNYCKITWVGGVPCSAIPANVVANDWQRPDLTSKWNGTDIAPSSGISAEWGQFAVDSADGLVYVGTGDTGPDWNGTLRPGPNLFANAVVAINMTNGAIVWADKASSRDINDYDCNLNTIYGQSGSTKVVLKSCKSAITFGTNALTGQPLWILDPSMPNYKQLGSSSVNSISQPFVCQAGNATSCNFGAMWDKIYAAYNAKTLHMAGTNPHPHGFITPGPYRASDNLDPTNATEMTQFVCPVGTNAQCIAIGNSPSSNKTGYIEYRYLMESENAFDGTNFYTAVMSGPSEHDYISDVSNKGQTGNVFGSDLYFSGQETTNTTILAINAVTGTVVWNYTRPIYYRGGIIATGGMVISDWPDGKLQFNDAKTGALIRSMDFGTPLLAPMSIAPDQNGVYHLLLTYGGTQHGILGENGLHGPLGHGYQIPGAVISLALGPAVAGTTTTVTGSGGGTVTTVTATGSGGQTITTTSLVTQSGAQATVTSTTSTGVSDIAFYGAAGVAVILAIVAGALVVMRRRPAA